MQSAVFMGNEKDWLWQQGVLLNVFIGLSLLYFYLKIGNLTKWLTFSGDYPLYCPC